MRGLTRDPDAEISADTFFKDRSWLCLEFKDLARAVEADVRLFMICKGACLTLSVGGSDADMRDWLRHWCRESARIESILASG